MKRLLVYHLMTALATLLLWVALACFSIRASEPWTGNLLFLLCVGPPFLGFPFASLAALSRSPPSLRFSWAALSFFCIAPAFMFFTGAGFLILLWFSGDQ